MALPIPFILGGVAAVLGVAALVSEKLGGETGTPDGGKPPREKRCKKGDEKPPKKPEKKPEEKQERRLPEQEEESETDKESEPASPN